MTVPPSTSSVAATPLKPHRLTAGEVIAALETDAHRGLSKAEARQRLERYGRNELRTEAPTPVWKKILAQFKGVLVLLLLAASAISTVLWAIERRSALPYDAIAILAIVLLNAGIGFIQEIRASSAIAALRRTAAARANVLREGEHCNLPAAELVPGDLILIEEGDTIPADARLIESISLQTAEASLTGESLPVPKDIPPVPEGAGPGDRNNMIFGGTTATYGRGTAIVTGTGMQSEMGRIAGLLERTPVEITPLQKELDRVGKVLGGVVVLIAVATIAVILVMEEVRSFSALFDVLIFGVALAVAAVPEGLPALVTTVLAIGVQRMARRHAIVRHLAAVETLGSATVIASDKTGTLTRNEMTVRAVLTAGGRVNFGGVGYEPAGTLAAADGESPGGETGREMLQLLTAASRANNASLQQLHGGWTIHGDPTEAALLVAARKAGLEAAALDARFERIDEIPFSSARRMMTSLDIDTTRPDRLLVSSKGAPGVILTHCSHELVGRERRPLGEARKKAILRANESLADEALRTLAVASRELPAKGRQEGLKGTEDLEQNLVFLGLIGMMDPPRDEIRAAVAQARRAGIRPVMITGDHPRTAASIARQLDIARDGRVLTGAELERLTDEELAERVREVSVYARVEPGHKLRIVTAFQHAGEIVAMTGDGVNDAPALKASDIGVAMGITGTDVSKESADIVLTDDNYATILAAVEEGRSIFDNIRKFLRYLLSSNIGEVMTMFFGVLLARVLGLHTEAGVKALPLLATQILWINLVTDGAPALALGLDPAAKGLMSRPPRPQHEGVITRTMWLGIGWVGAVMAAGTLLVLDASLPNGLIEGSGDLRHARTMAFTTLVMFQLFNVFNARSEERSAFSGLFQNRWLWIAVGLSLILQLAAVYLPFLQSAFSTTSLDATDWLLCTIVASSVLWLGELSKFILRARAGSASTSVGQAVPDPS